MEANELDVPFPLIPPILVGFIKDPRLSVKRRVGTADCRSQASFQGKMQTEVKCTLQTRGKVQVAEPVYP